MGSEDFHTKILSLRWELKGTPEKQKSAPSDTNDAAFPILGEVVLGQRFPLYFAPSLLEEVGTNWRTNGNYVFYHLDIHLSALSSKLSYIDYSKHLAHIAKIKTTHMVDYGSRWISMLKGLVSWRQDLFGVFHLVCRHLWRPQVRTRPVTGYFFTPLGRLI